MSKKKLFILFILSIVFIVSLSTVFASSGWYTDFNCSPPYIGTCRVSGLVIAQDDSFFNPFDNDSCSAVTNGYNVNGPACKITCQASMTYSSGGSVKYIYSQTKSGTLYNANYGASQRVSVDLNSSISNAITAYGYHSASPDNYGTRSGTSNESF